MQEAFEQCVSEWFPVDAKRGTSGVIRAAFTQKGSSCPEEPSSCQQEPSLLYEEERTSLVGFETIRPALKLSSFACEFQNGPAGFKTVQPTLKPSDGFEAGRVSNQSITYIP